VRSERSPDECAASDLATGIIAFGREVSLLFHPPHPQEGKSLGSEAVPLDLKALQVPGDPQF
jgi:hypothetical protein